MSQKFLHHIDVPFKCPFSNCHQLVSSSNLLSHTTQVHHVQVRGVVDGEKVPLLINHAYLTSGESVCIGALALKSDDGKIVHENALLSCEVEKFRHCFPIFVMAALETLHNSFSIWLAAPSMKAPLWCTLTVHDQHLRKSSSQLTRVRRVEDSQELQDFMATEITHLTSNLGFIEQIKCEKSFYAEISVIMELK